MSAVNIRPLDRPGDLGWVVQAHGELYAREFGWDTDFERMVAGIVGEYATKTDPEHQAAWIAEVDGERAGSIFCMPAGEPECAKLRLLVVDPRFRGLGVGGALVDECMRFASEAGYRRMTLWTDGQLESARKIYQAAGFELVDETPHHSFGHDLVGQNWEMMLPRLQ